MCVCFPVPVGSALSVISPALSCVAFLVVSCLAPGIAASCFEGSIVLPTAWQNRAGQAMAAAEHSTDTGNWNGADGLNTDSPLYSLWWRRGGTTTH